MTRQNGLMASLKAFKARLAQTNGYKAMKRNIKLIEIIAIPVVFAALPIAVNHKVNSTQIPQHVQNNPKFIAYAIKFFNLQGRLLCLFNACRFRSLLCCLLCFIPFSRSPLQNVYLKFILM